MIVVVDGYRGIKGCIYAALLKKAEPEPMGVSRETDFGTFAYLL